MKMKSKDDRAKRGGHPLDGKASTGNSDAGLGPDASFDLKVIRANLAGSTSPTTPRQPRTPWSRPPPQPPSRRSCSSNSTAERSSTQQTSASCLSHNSQRRDSIDDRLLDVLAMYPPTRGAVATY